MQLNHLPNPCYFQSKVDYWLKIDKQGNYPNSWQVRTGVVDIQQAVLYVHVLHLNKNKLSNEYIYLYITHSSIPRELPASVGGKHYSAG